MPPRQPSPWHPRERKHNVPDELLRATFERYWSNFTDRRDGKVSWDAYTPYELRVAGSFVRLGWRERTYALLDYFFKDQRPAAWNQWAEVVGRELRQPRFIGDMPHAWIASDYIRSVLDMFSTSARATKRWCWRREFQSIGSMGQALRQGICARPTARSICPSDPKEPTSSLKSPATRTRPAASFCLSLGRALPMSTARPPRRPFEMASCTLPISRSRSASCEQTRADTKAGAGVGHGARRQHFKNKMVRSQGPGVMLWATIWNSPLDSEV